MGPCARQVGELMRLKIYQWGELVGIVLLLASTAAQMFTWSR
jgi:hypothetical protein